MKEVRLHLDDKLYYRIKNSDYSVNELIALGIRLKQIKDIFDGKDVIQSSCLSEDKKD